MTDNEKLYEKLHDVMYADHGHSLPPGVRNCRTCDRRVKKVMAVFEKAHTPTDAPTVQFTARKGGKSQALIESMLAQANQRGIRVEVVHLHGDPTKEQGEPSDAQVMAASVVLDGQIAFDLLRAALRAASAVTEQGENR